MLVLGDGYCSDSLFCNAEVKEREGLMSLGLEPESEKNGLSRRKKKTQGCKKEFWRAQYHEICNLCSSLRDLRA